MNGKSNNHEFFLTRTFLLAQKAFQNGNRPFGALLTVNNKLLVESENTVNNDKDITAHAEMNLIRSAWKQFSIEMLQQAILYTSTEPCMMCAGAIVNSPIKRVVYGCRAVVMHQQMDQYPCMTGKTVLLSSESVVKVEGPLLEDEALSVHLNNKWW